MSTATPSDSPTATPGPELSRATVVVTAGRPRRERGAPVNTSAVQTSTYVSSGVPAPGDLLYGRYANPTWDAFEEALAELESCPLPALVTASGMAAIAAVASLVPPGGRLVLPTHAYLLTGALFDDLATRSGIEVQRVDIADLDAVRAAVRGDSSQRTVRAADLLWVESPTNPMLEVTHLPALIRDAHELGALVAVDNTFATPMVQRPLESGADVVVHSVTKFLAGHSDVVLGAVLTPDAGLRERLLTYRSTHGSIAGPWETWLALRGLRTLALRVERAQRSAEILAERLAAHPAVLEVRHPSLPADPGHQFAQQTMDGFGAVLAIRTVGGPTSADAVVDALRVWVPATSLGGVESMVERRRRLPAESTSVPEDLLRLSVGIEDVEDLWADLNQALASI